MIALKRKKIKIYEDNLKELLRLIHTAAIFVQVSSVMFLQHIRTLHSQVSTQNMHIVGSVYLRLYSLVPFAAVSCRDSGEPRHQ